VCVSLHPSLHKQGHSKPAETRTRDPDVSAVHINTHVLPSFTE